MLFCKLIEKLIVRVFVNRSIEDWLLGSQLLPIMIEIWDRKWVLSEMKLLPIGFDSLQGLFDFCHCFLLTSSLLSTSLNSLFILLTAMFVIFLWFSKINFNSQIHFEFARFPPFMMVFVSGQ
jgi:hypothetical protein